MKKIIAANWKMNLTIAESKAYVSDLKLEVTDENAADIVLIPPFTMLPAVSEALNGWPAVKLGAQNMWHETGGAFTGEISAGMLREIYVRYVVLGHSERRQILWESDELINRKVKAAHKAQLRPIFCLGETLTERDAGAVESVLERQLREGLAGLNADELEDTVLAYEPVWAIGTGRTATPAQAQEAHAFIRSVLATLSSAETARKVRIQYGGSVKPDNARELMSQPDIDGALVGGASLDARSFAKIVNAAAAA